MNTRILVTISLLVGIGAVLNGVVPAIFTMKPDMTLLMMFLAIVLFPKRKYVLLVGLSTGFISALTTTFPSGQIPNMLDKPITAFIFFGLFLLVKRFSTRLTSGILTFIGTVASGFIFLTSALVLFGLPAGFLALFTTVVIPAAIINTILMTILYPIVINIQKRTNLVTV
ncbi:tryptophan transporter [Bacillus sp. DJP31]|uniref:tryptophan transporter n=1 Tax=Bacillus sp. DJP31 TaxID=3409789 RepID=UPI003BB5974A